MSLDRPLRLRTVETVLAEFNTMQLDSPALERRVNTILAGFGLDEVPVGAGRGDFLDEVRRELQKGSDTALTELAQYLSVSIRDSGSATDSSGLWSDDVVRVFLSHSAIHKTVVSEIAQSLNEYGLQGFVAHEDIQVTKSWQDEIVRALNTCDVFVGLVHPEFVKSVWTNQEIGWAYGRGVPLFMIRLGEVPRGFPGSTQWESMPDRSPSDVAGRIAGWVNGLPAYSATIATRLIRQLREAGNYYAAQAAGEAIDGCGSLTDSQWVQLDEAYLANDQVHGSILATRALRPLYERYGRKFPVA